MADADALPRPLRVLFNVHEPQRYRAAGGDTTPLEAAFTLGGDAPEIEVLEWLRSDFGALEADDLRGYIASRDWPVVVVSDAFFYEDEPIGAVVLRIGGIACFERDDLLGRGDMGARLARMAALGS